METTTRRGVSGAVLKWIAVVSMFIDHVTAVYFETWYWVVNRMTMDSYRIYIVLRGVGRFAFPIYCFLLVEGYFHTRNVGKYILRLLVFGLVSELPFDLAFERTWFTPGYQNVYFTLAIGLTAVWLWDIITKKDPRTHGWWRVLPALAAAAALAWLAEICNTDYGWTGVTVIVLMYLFRERGWLRFFTAGPVLLAAGTIEGVSWPDFLLFRWYNGQRGRQPKYFFYIFYPAHLALLALARYLFAGL